MNDRFSGRRVLLVEDEPIVAWLLKDMLVDLGCSIVGPAADVNQALAMIEAESIDVAVLDANLRGQMSYPVADVPPVERVEHSNTVWTAHHGLAV